jgi:hypothetical protein
LQGANEPQKRNKRKTNNTCKYFKSTAAYRSHTRKDFGKKLMPSQVTLAKIYTEYKECQGNPVSSHPFKKEFYNTKCQ